jgi:hypothetical protein
MNYKTKKRMKKLNLLLIALLLTGIVGCGEEEKGKKI